MFKLFKKKEEQTLTDDELFSSLKDDGLKVPAPAIQGARNGDGKALYYIGFTYYLNKNYSKALPWLKKGAVQNHNHCQHRVGVMYDNGQGVSKDYQQAMYWYLKAVNNHKNSNSQNNIGNMYLGGRGVPIDYKQAMDWYLKAVNNDGNPDAQNGIGLLYMYGYGVPKNIHTAMEWFTKAANQGDKLAQFNLAERYAKEDGIKDLQQAVNWYKKAADNGDEAAKKALKKLNKKGYYPKDNLKATEVNTKKEEPQTKGVLNSNDSRDQGREVASNTNSEQVQLPSLIEINEDINELIKEKTKKLEEAFQLKLELLQQDKMDKEMLQQKRDQDKKDREVLQKKIAALEEKMGKNISKTKLEQDEVKVETEKDQEIKQLKEALKKTNIALDSDPNSDICYDSSSEVCDNDDSIDNKTGTKKENSDDDYQNDINYDSASNDDDGGDDNDDWKNGPNYDSPEDENTNKDLNYDG